ncbi:hypothetical protein OHB41_10285 [Streptomyces sp. NBC_01571]|uniref:hypothetical protein n=1 Tax=Streptomyces sp. NBC_01571 TaxID=2975883 RepID=UPI002250A4ED|nr:hypothetical protein [Streptomyces sp. NBC_01571]MCX4573562.1 hypothetical protein [Streptomyces sp. NBC_01571]
MQRGSGICRVCSSRATVLYVVVDDCADVLKFGITTGNPKIRLRHHRRDGHRRAARIHTGLPEGAALEIERALI